MKLHHIFEAKYHLQWEPSEDTQRWMNEDYWVRLPDSKKEIIKSFEKELNDIFDQMEWEYDHALSEHDPEWGELEMDFREVAMYAKDSWKKINKAIGDKGLITISVIEDFIDMMVETILEQYDDED